MHRAPWLLRVLLISGVAAGTVVPATAAFAAPSVDEVQQRQVAEVVAARAEVSTERQGLDALIATQLAQQKDLATRKTKIEKDLQALYELRRQAYGAAQEARSISSGPVPTVSGRAGVAVKFAYGALGKPYVWAADGPAGYDCSGLTLAAWRAAGVSLPHNAEMQWGKVAHISRSAALQPGDLVFYSNLGHVALFVGSGKVIHAPTFGEVVKVSTVDMMRPYGYGRPR